MFGWRVGFIFIWQNFITRMRRRRQQLKVKLWCSEPLKPESKCAARMRRQRTYVLRGGGAVPLAGLLAIMRVQLNIILYQAAAADTTADDDGNEEYTRKIYIHFYTM